MCRSPKCMPQKSCDGGKNPSAGHESETRFAKRIANQKRSTQISDGTCHRPQIPLYRGMTVDLAFGGLVAARLLLSFAPLPDQLKFDHLLSSPLTSNLRCNRLPKVWI